MAAAIAITIGALDPASFARLVVLQAAAIFTGVVLDLGTSQLLTREIAAGRVQPRRGIREVLGLRLRLVPVALAVLLITSSFASGRQLPAEAYLFALCAYTVSQATAQLALASLRGLGQFQRAGGALAVGRLTGTVLCLAVVLLDRDPSVLDFLLAFTAGEAAIIAVAWGRNRAAWGHARLAAARQEPLKLRSAAPFALSALMVTAYNRLDTILVAALATGATLAHYAPASRIQDALFVVPLAAATVLFPVLSAPLTPEQLRRRFSLATAFSAGASAIAAVGVIIAAPVLLPYAGAEYEGAIVPVQIIVLSLPVIAINSCLVSLLNARGHAGLALRGVATALMSFALLASVLVPRYGAEGAAIAAAGRDVPAVLVLAWLSIRAGVIPASALGLRRARK